MFHHFPGRAGASARLPRALDRLHLLARSRSGRRAQPGLLLPRWRSPRRGYQPRRTAAIDAQSLPPVEFEYTEPIVAGRRCARSTAESLENLPDRPRRQRLPLGRPGRRGHPRHPHRAGRRLVLQAQPEPDRRSRPDGDVQAEARFAPLEAVALKPNARAGRRRAVHGPGRRRPARPRASRRARRPASTSTTTPRAGSRSAPSRSLPEPRLARPEPAGSSISTATATPTC